MLSPEQQSVAQGTDHIFGFANDCFVCRLVPNVGLEDESPSSKSEESPEEEKMGEDGTKLASDGSPVTQSDVDAQRSPRHQTFTNGERRRRKLPEIPKNRKRKYINHVVFGHKS